MAISVGVLVEQEQHLQDIAAGFGATGHLKGLKKSRIRPGFGQNPWVL
jgi:hypothetical protein